MKKKSLNKFCGKEASVLLYMYVKYRIFTQNIYKIFAIFPRGILAFVLAIYNIPTENIIKYIYLQFVLVSNHCSVSLPIENWIEKLFFLQVQLFFFF